AVVNELHKPVVERRGFFLSGRFDPQRRDIPYATLAHALRGLVQQLLSGSDEELATWRERLRQAWGDQGQLMVSLVPQLEFVAGPQPPLPELPIAESRHRLNRVFRQFLGLFATPEHPLVVFLDDLQWADPASLQLLQHLLTHPKAPPVLWLGAYRDDEPDALHPLKALQEELRKARTRVTDLELEPLSPEQLRALVAEALPSAGEALLRPFSLWAHGKTGGNPFLLVQWLQTLHQDGLLVRTPEGSWRWDAERVQALGYSDSVVDFIVRKLRQLPPRTQHLLSRAACVGGSFPLPLLAALCGIQELGEVEQCLEPALQEGVVARSGPEEYRFLHDRLQQAAMALLSEQECAQVHLSIGRLLLARLSPEETRERLFEIVSHLNTGAKLLSEPAERQHLARLNAEAGRKAMASAAYRPASRYLKESFELLPAEPWETDLELAFGLQRDRARCALLSLHFAEARPLVEDLVHRARGRAQTVAAYRLRTELLLATGEIPSAVTSSLECLALLGVHLPQRPSWAEVVAAHEETWALLSQRPRESLVALPRMDDEGMKEEMDALDMLFGPAYFTDNHLLILLLCRIVTLTLRHGFTDTAVHGLSWFGVVSGSFFKRYQEGLALSLLALELVERHKLPAHKARVLFSLQFIFYWTRPLPAALELAREGYQHALQVGELMTASYCCGSVITNRLGMGHSLDDIYQESLSLSDFLRRSGAADPQGLFLFNQRYVQHLRGHTLSFHTLSGEGFDERQFEASLRPERMSTLRCAYWMARLKSRFMCGAYAEALEAADKAAELLWAMLGSLQLLDFHLYRALSLARSLTPATAGEQPQRLMELEQHHQQLSQWASLCADTFRAPERMVAAELARLKGRSEQAATAYEEAIQLAREHHFNHHEAVACELAANFWRSRRFPSIAHALAREAHTAYLRWGARGKARHLESQWLGLAPPTELVNTPAARTDSAQLDALTVVKAQQAISGEIVLERLADTLLRVAIENAGAQHGALLLPEGEGLSVAASTAAGGFGARLPWSLINYARRTREHVLIDDATKPHAFPSDEYLSGGQVRSVLCLPLSRKGKLHGVLYLENNLAAGAFTAGRLALLGQLASQAAISLENARLYADVQRTHEALRRANDELERRVEERTRELKEAQTRLVSTAREVGMAEVAASVLHNVGNVLNSAVINLEVMRQTVGSLRIGQLKRATDLLVANRDGLVEFLSPEGRGRNLPSYLSAVSGVLIDEQARLLEDLEAMGKHIEHIRSIIVVQQTYAKASMMTEECDLAHLIRDALRIQMHALKRHGVHITHELAALPRVRVDKHKLLQILINLIANARDALDPMPEDQRRLHIRLSAEGPTARIQVVDTGLGIAPEIRERLFQHGFTTRKQGHGFGLHTSALAARMLGGRLLLESEGPGKGATATLEIPCAQD
ncbi:MAG TPA: AAA family ATPase, partial [Myxococcaceae bacterium]